MNNRNCKYYERCNQRCTTRPLLCTWYEIYDKERSLDLKLIRQETEQAQGVWR